VKDRSFYSFRNNLGRLPAGDQRLLVQLLPLYFLPAIDAGSFSGSPPWPKRLRVLRLSNTEIYSLTWNFASPDGRATFHLDKGEDGKAMVVWRRIGDHGAYDRP